MKVIFLDIDGVLQPYDSELRFMDLDKDFIEMISNKYCIDYSQYDKYDVAAAYYDWDQQAVTRLKYVLDETYSKIITSSDWRSKNKKNKIRDLLKLRDLDSYWVDDNIILDYVYGGTPASKRAQEIFDSLGKYDIDKYVVLDDMKELYSYYPDNCVITRNIISINNMNDCIKILERKIK